MEIQERASLGWTGVVITTIFMVIVSGLILYPQITIENVLTVLRFSSLTTALPFLLVFVAKPLVTLNIFRDLGQWLQTNRRYLWLILTISHLLHLYQIVLYYQLGNSCPFLVWVLTTPLWLIMVLYSVVELMKPQIFDQLNKNSANRKLNIVYQLGNWYIWLIFTLAFGLGTLAKSLLFYNIPALILFLACAIAYCMTWWGVIRK
ncbi:hypothetical protein [Cyanobacterium aponinum]|uniref:Ferric oxidoreductase domain-containing protein n=1 Tax=Cyanobacterium aponinum (strain PCC 10605) TaxID=755178 RepID=K9Z4E3_CYAAP|nr:hypothetical protein [Cyanobacterium aponinum]AFZ54009.1 hypothetical protein Cyan10605_1911 [Cyanobacterium aponinum PCC 10605]